ncbi:ABC transporter permease [Clostridium sp. AL.422]|uniref:ABC transporter permease n=1 Tax=Clostridium TaxID=1485 RepID=UPI00293DD514|nr:MULTISPECIES: ABC transporter permease [unclassified Clostridium]MDV4151138.1 ABC transporter permease [Clostridium sp. AL.422]
MKELKKIWIFIKGFIILNILWYIFSLLMNSRILPSPLKIYANLPNLFKNDFHVHIYASLYRVGIGLLIAFIIGITIGLIMGYSDKINKLLNPIIYFTYPIPKMALLPITMTLGGLGDGSKIAMIVLIIVFQIIVSVRDSVINVSKEDYNMLISLGAKRLELFYHVTMPSILPDILTNIRLSIGTAFSILFFSEAYGTSKGVGYFIQDAWSRINYIDLYSGILILSILGLILFLLLDFIENVVCRWKK